MKSTLLIDADGLAFAIAAAGQKVIQWDDDVFSTSADLGEMKNAFVLATHNYQQASGAGKVVLCFSCPTRRYFRHDIYPSYKSNRGNTPKPIALNELIDWAKKEYVSYTRPHLEADDVVGILATNKTIFKGPKVICSIDKDFAQIPAPWINPNKLDEGMNERTPEECQAAMWMQVLTGDTVDGYPGCPGIGPVKAARILEDVDPAHYEETVLKAYIAAQQTPEYFAQMVNCARILLSKDYNFKEKEPKLFRV